MSFAQHLQKILRFNFYTKGGLLAKSGKLIFQGRSFLEGKIQKNGNNFLKNFIVPKHLLGHTNHLYTYKGHIEQVGFTLKHQKTTEIVILSQYFDIFI